MTAGRSPRARALAGVLAAAALAGCGTERAPAVTRCSPTGPGWIAWSAYVESGGGGQFDVRLSRLDGSCARTLADDPESDLDPFLSSSAGVLVHAGVRAGIPRLVATTWETGERRGVDTGVLKVAAPALSPDGAAVAFQGFAGVEQPDVYVIPLAGGAPLQLTAAAGFDGKPSWAPDGSALYFLSDRSGRGEIWRTAPDGTMVDPVLVTTPALGGAVMGRPAVSPDGRALAFPRASAGGQTRVVVRTIATGAERVLADADDGEPSWDATGAYLAVVTRTSGAAQVVVRDASTGALVARPDPATALQGAPSFAR